MPSCTPRSLELYHPVRHVHSNSAIVYATNTRTVPSCTPCTLDLCHRVRHVHSNSAIVYATFTRTLPSCTPRILELCHRVRHVHSNSAILYATFTRTVPSCTPCSLKLGHFVRRVHSNSTILYATFVFTYTVEVNSVISHDPTWNSWKGRSSAASPFVACWLSWGWEQKLAYVVGIAHVVSSSGIQEHIGHDGGTMIRSTTSNASPLSVGNGALALPSQGSGVFTYIYILITVYSYSRNINKTPKRPLSVVNYTCFYY